MIKIQAIILGAGKGKRLNCRAMPKVMFELEGKPMIHYSIENLARAGFKKPVVVIGFRGEKVKRYLGKKALYAWQKKRLGTAHAVQSAQLVVGKETETVLVIGGDDSAFYDPRMLEELVRKHLAEKAEMTLLTVRLKDPKGLGRIVKGKDNCVKEIVEEKLASPQVKKIKEVNTGCYVFQTAFLWGALKKVKKNPTGEYFLTDLVAIGNREGRKIIAYQTDPEHWHGVNTPEQLEAARAHMKSRSGN